MMFGLNENKINKKDYPNGFPGLKFIDSNKTVTGFTGCNRLSGTYKVDNSELPFSPLITTKMFCEGVRENNFLKALDSINGFKIENSKLLLLQNSATKLIFNKAD